MSSQEGRALALDRNQLIELFDLIAEFDGERIVLKLAGVSYSLHGVVTFPACCSVSLLEPKIRFIRSFEKSSGPLWAPEDLPLLMKGSLFLSKRIWTMFIRSVIRYRWHGEIRLYPEAGKSRLWHLLHSLSRYRLALDN